MTARILIVDDYEPNLKLLEARLSYEYFQVYKARDGRGAIECACTFRSLLSQRCAS